MKSVSKMESVVLEQGKRIITTLDVIGMFTCTKNEASVILHRMTKKGLLVRLKRGVYARAEENSLAAFSDVAKQYYFSFITALNFHGLTDQVPMTSIAVSLKNKKILNIKIVKVLPKKFFGFEKVNFQGAEIFMADREKALIDSLDKPQYAGGIKHVIGCFKNKYNARKLVVYAFCFDNTALIRRLGYILDKHKIKIPCLLKKQMLAKSEKIPYYTKLANKGIPHSRDIKWMVIDNVG